MLAAGTRTLRVLAGADALTAELAVENAGLVRGASVESGAPGEPIEVDAHRVFRFGPVTREHTDVEISDDEVIAAGEWIRVGEYFVSVEATGRAAQAV